MSDFFWPGEGVGAAVLLGFWAFAQEKPRRSGVLHEVG